MQITIDKLKKIYAHLEDETSKEIFENRLMYSISGDNKWILKNIRAIDKNLGKEFLETLETAKASGEIVIFGAGVRGRKLYEITQKYPWKYFVDNDPKEMNCLGLSIIKGDEFIKGYCGEYIFITPRAHAEIYKQLLSVGIPKDKIFNVGEILDKLIESTYFGLEQLKPAKDKEIFLDIGGYDGMTSLYFSRWCKRDSKVYIFEPDKENIEKCKINLRDKLDSYQIIPKGAWNEITKLKFQSRENQFSKVSDLGEEEIPVTTIDDELCGVPVTFIKMDIEGSELPALFGAEKTIMKNRPKLAISIYHKPEDIWEIPEVILRFNPSYKLYIRHYSLSEYDTVLYALPE